MSFGLEKTVNYICKFYLLRYHILATIISSKDSSPKNIFKNTLVSYYIIWKTKLSWLYYLTFCFRAKSFPEIPALSSISFWSLAFKQVLGPCWHHHKQNFCKWIMDCLWPAIHSRLQFFICYTVKPVLTTTSGQQPPVYNNQFEPQFPKTDSNLIEINCEQWPLCL